MAYNRRAYNNLPFATRCKADEVICQGYFHYLSEIDPDVILLWLQEKDASGQLVEHIKIEDSANFEDLSLPRVFVEDYYSWKRQNPASQPSDQSADMNVFQGAIQPLIKAHRRSMARLCVAIWLTIFLFIAHLTISLIQYPDVIDITLHYGSSWIEFVKAQISSN